MKHIPRRIFREPFKRESIRLVNEQGLTMNHISIGKLASGAHSDSDAS